MLRRVVQTSRRAVAGRGLSYKAPTKDLKFLFADVFQLPKLWDEAAARTKNDTLAGVSSAWEDIMEQCAKMAEQTLFPLYQPSDSDSSRFDAKTVNVITPKGWKEAMKIYNEGGWNGLCVPEEFGGQGFPHSLHTLRGEIIGEANWPFSMFPMLSSGAVNTLLQYGTPEQQKKYIPPLATGEFTGTMCLTEPHCGTDLALLKTKAEPIPGLTECGAPAYKITGTKIFISSGEHDLHGDGGNIIHIVLGRLPGAPEGVKGISLFLVPKYAIGVPGFDGKKKNVVCSGTEHKMGIHGNPTCVMQFENSVGFLIGKPNSGLAQMFTFMNHARLGVATQGVCHAELSHQNAVAYTNARLSGRCLAGTVCPDKAADPIINHSDVRRNLLFQKVIAEGGRWLLYKCASLQDLGEFAKTEEERKAAESLLGFLIPIAKAFLTEAGCEASYNGMQVFGGHGYIVDWGMEQIYRDCRIATLYEGTTGIQAADLIGRKTLLDKFRNMQLYKKDAQSILQPLMADAKIGRLAKAVGDAIAAYEKAIMSVVKAVETDKSVLNAAADDNMRALGYITLSLGHVQMAAVAARKLEKEKGKLGEEEVKLLTGKAVVAQFACDKLLPRAHGHIMAMTTPFDSITKIPNSTFLCEWM